MQCIKISLLIVKYIKIHLFNKILLSKKYKTVTYKEKIIK